MSKKILVLAAIALSSQAWSAETSTGVTRASVSGAPPAPTEQQVIEQFRTDLQASRADVMAKGLKLTAEEAAKFWPLFEQYQKEQGQIVEGQLKATQKYAAGYASLSEADALSYINALLERDAKVHDLRVKWLAKFQTVVPPKVAARAIQLERRMGIVTQVKISSQIPLIR
jgi:Spy/CpxP family protein refolding chaperone